jgi:hypothetical protein
MDWRSGNMELYSFIYALADDCDVASRSQLIVYVQIKIVTPLDQRIGDKALASLSVSF